MNKVEYLVTKIFDISMEAYSYENFKDMLRNHGFNVKAEEERTFEIELIITGEVSGRDKEYTVLIYDHPDRFEVYKVFISS